MVSLVSLGSLLGVLVVPLIGGDQLKKKKKTKSWRTLVYKYLYFFMIALGTSALLSDAILHLLPHVSHTHTHTHTLSLYLSLSHTHTHTHTHTLSLSL